jgi:gluconolactonase
VRFASVADGVGFTEGPVALRDGALAFVSVDQGFVHRADGIGCRVLAATGGGPNGLAEGADGTLYVAQNGGRWSAHPRPTFTGGVQAVSPDGEVRWVTQDPIAPNDLCVGPDGALYVTDPTRRPAMDDGRLWRIDPATGDADLLASVAWYPNGIGFGPDGALYVARTGERRILRYADGTGAPEDFCEVAGLPDGLAWDADGRLIVCSVGVDAAGTLEVRDADGALVDTIAPGAGRHYTNVALSARAVLYVTDADAGRVLAAEWPCPGLPLHPWRPVDKVHDVRLLFHRERSREEP